jgi:hypothetical protein
VLPPDFQDAAFEDFEAVFASGFLGGCLSVAVHHKKQGGPYVTARTRRRRHRHRADTRTSCRTRRLRQRASRWYNAVCQQC